MENTNQTLMTQTSAAAGTLTQPEANEGIRFYQGRILDELPGLAFAVLTLAWVVGCFFKLTW